MSYDLFPVNENVKDISIGAFSWPVLLRETGCGFLIGYGEARRPASYVYKPDKRGASPVSNDGYRITARQAKIMAELCFGYISVHQFIQKEWDALPVDRREHEWDYKDPVSKRGLYNKPAGKEFLDLVKKFADFAEKSGGFRIN